MKTQTKSHRKINSISSGRWTAYMAAAAASSFAGVGSAEAEIHYSGVINARFRGDNSYGGKRFPLRHSARLSFFEFTYNWDFSVNGAGVSNNFCGYTTRRFGFRYVSRLSEGAVISNCAFLAESGTRALLFDFYGGGQFAKGGIGFVGFRFNNGSGMQYGWARVKTQGHNEEGLMLLDYAWADPGQSISAGQTSSNDTRADAIPDQGSLGLLAVGGAGLMAWRKRRAKVR
jgi:hypothetical protein